MSSNNKNYRTMDDETRAMVKAYERELMHATMEWQAAKNRLHNAKINRGDKRRVVSTLSGFNGKVTYKPGLKISQLIELVKEREAVMEEV